MKSKVLIVFLFIEVALATFLNSTRLLSFIIDGKNVSFQLMFFKSLSKQAHTLCANSERFHSCYYNSLQTFRVEKVYWVNRILNHLLNETALTYQEAHRWSTDVLVLGLTYGYDVTAGERMSPYCRICIIGELSLKVFLTVLTTSCLMQVTLVQRSYSPDDLSIVQRFQSILNEMGGNLRVITLQEDLLAKENFWNFDVVHFRGQNETFVQRVVNRFVATRASTQASGNLEELPSSLVVIWEKYLTVNSGKYNEFLDQRMPSFHNILDERLTSSVAQSMVLSWPTNSVIEVKNDSEGFAGRRFGIFMGLRNNFLDTLVSVIHWSSVDPRQCLGETRKSNSLLSKSCVATEMPPFTVVLTYTVRIFEENARAFAKILRKLGYKNVVVVGDLELASDRTNLHRRWDYRRTLQIAFGAHEAHFLLPHYIIYQGEQLDFAVNGDVSFTYRRILRQAAAVWTFSEVHRQHLLTNDIAFQVFVVPFYSLLISDHEQVVGPINMTSSDTNKVISKDGGVFEESDILFYGGLSQRRKEIFKTVLPEFASELTTRNLKFRMVTGTMGSFYYDIDKELLIASSKVVLYLHGLSSASLSVHRIHHLLALGKCVVAERSSSDPNLDQGYAEAVVFVESPEAAFRRALEIVENEEERKACEYRSRVLYERIMSDTEEIEKSMKLVVEMLGYDTSQTIV